MGELIDAVHQARRAQHAIENSLYQVKEALLAEERKLVRAERHRHNTATLYRARVSDARVELRKLEARLEEARLVTAKVEQALAEVQEGRWWARVAALRSLVARVGGPDIFLEDQGGGWSGLAGGRRFALTLTTPAPYGVDAPFARRFGCTVSVTGPFLRSPKDEEERAWAGPMLNWPTLGSISLDTARDLVRLNATAIALAEELERVCDEWYVRDLAD